MSLAYNCKCAHPILASIVTRLPRLERHHAQLLAGPCAAVLCGPGALFACSFQVFLEIESEFEEGQNEKESQGFINHIIVIMCRYVHPIYISPLLKDFVLIVEAAVKKSSLQCTAVVCALITDNKSLIKGLVGA